MSALGPTLRRVATALFVGLLVAGPALAWRGGTAQALASTPFDNISIDGAWRTTQGANWLAQSFSTGTNGLRVTDVGLRLRNANEANSSAVSGTYSVSVWSASGNAPGSALGSVVTGQGLGAWGEDSSLRTLSSPINLEPNSRYFVVLAGSAGSTIGWKCNSSAVTTDVTPAPTHAAFSSANSGSSWVSLSGTCAAANFAMKVTGTARTAPTLTDFGNVNATLGDAALTITAPTTSVAGTFAYASSDTNVATVSGNQLSFLGIGTSTVTATFTPTNTDSYTGATITMTVTVGASTSTTPTSSTSTTSSTSSTTSTTPPTMTAPSSTTTTSTTTTVAASTTTTRPARTTTTSEAPKSVALPSAATTTSSTTTTTTTPSTTTTTASPPTTSTLPPVAPVGAMAEPTAPSDNIFGDSEANQAVMHIDATPGIDVGSGIVRVRAVGLSPGSPVNVSVFSEPQTILETTVDANGNLDTSAPLPAGLGPGRHTVVLAAKSTSGDIAVVGALTVTDDGRVGEVIQPAPIANFAGPSDSRLVRAVELGKPVYDPASRPLTTASVVVAATGLIALAGAAGMAGSPLAVRDGGDDSQRRRNSRGKLAGAVTKKLKGLQVNEEARGDSSRTWRVPGTARADAISGSLPNKVGKWSALAPRIVVDGSWLRAMFGSFGWISWAVGLVLGVVASFVDTRSPLTPAFGMIVTIAVLGIIDAGAGAIAWCTLVAIALVGGDLSNWPDVRTALGLGLVFASVPLLAHVIRPLRRYLRDSSFERWERIFDYVMMPVFVAFATGSMLKALNGLSGLELVTPAQVSTMRWTVAIAIIVRLALEDIAAHHYPRRMAEVQPKKLVSPNRRVTSVSITARSLVFLMVAEPFFGINIRTIIATLLLAIPLVLKMWEDDLPNSAVLNKWLPRGLFRFLCTLVLGAYLTSTLIGADGGDAAVRSSFIWMLLPGVVLGVVELFGRSGGDWPNVTVKRSLGAIVWVLAAGIVTGNIVLFG